jgi:uncharacterized protein with PQ loop repeat
MNQTINTMGIVGNVLLVIGYFPQIIKIITTKKAEDLSLMMWINFLVGDLLLLIYAIYTGDYIFSVLFAFFTIGNLVTMALTIKYGKKDLPNV